MRRMLLVSTLTETSSGAVVCFKITHGKKGSTTKNCSPLLLAVVLVRDNEDVLGAPDTSTMGEDAL